MSKSSPRSTSRSRFTLLLILSFFAVVVLTQQIYFTRRVRAASFTAGNVVVYRVGDGVGTLSGSAAAVFLDEYTPTGTLVQSIPLPTAVNGLNKRLTSSGSAANDGLLTRSANGQYIVLTGYDANVGTANVATSLSSAVSRVIGRVDASGTIDTTTVFAGTAGNSFSGGNIRSVATDAGTNLWAIGSVSGVQFITLGATSSTQVSSAVTNLRGTSIFGGQLYISTASGTAVRVGAVGSGTPTTTSQAITNLPGFPTAGNPNSFFFADLTVSVPGLDTLYVADDSAGIQKYSLVGSSWVANGSVTASSVRGLAASVQGSTVTLYGTTGGIGASGGGSLYKFIDSTGYNVTMSGTATTIATAGTNKAFRGVVLTPSNSSTNPTLTVNPTGTGTGSVTSSSGGINCPGTCSATYGSGTVVILTPAANVNSSFTGWSGCDSVSGNNCTVTMSASRTVSPTFTSTLRTLNVSRTGTGTGTVTSVPPGINCGGTCSATYSDGQMVALTASAGVNSSFTSWSGCDSVSGSTCNVTMNATRNVTATFTSSLRTLSVSRTGTGTGTVTSSPAGINCGSTCSATYSDGTLVTLTATADTLSTFAGWSGACTGTGACTITMDGDKSATATFTFAAPSVKISQVYGGGGNSGSTYTNDFIELYNSGSTPVSLNGWTVQDTSASGTDWSNGINGPPTALSGTIQPGHYYLIQEAQGSTGGTTSLPTPDAVGSLSISGSASKVTLVASTAVLSGACPLGGFVVDFVGYGGATCAEGGAAASGTANTTATLRRGNGCQDTDNNAADFVTVGPIPRNSLSPANGCGGDPTQPSGLGIASPDSVDPASSSLLTVAVTPATNAPSTGIAVSADLTSIGGVASQTFYDDGTNGDTTAGDNVFSYRAIVGAAITTGAKSIVATVTDAQARSVAVPITLTVQSPTCGVERWSVKVGTDPDAAFVDLNNPVRTTVADLGTIPAPADPPGPPVNARVAPTETTLYTVYATMTLYKKENDVDYHIVLQDGSNSMIAEIPSPACILAQNPSGPGRVLVSSPFTQGIMDSRAKFDARFSATTFFQTANVPVRVTGVGFFDFQHGQTGVAPNGIELHPIISIDFTANTTTTLMSSVNPLQYGQSVSITATVTNGTPGLPTGNVNFFDGGSLIGTRTLDVSGQATFNTSTLSTGSHSITASYEGDNTSSPSTSTALNQVVNKASSLTTVTCSSSQTYTGSAIEPCSATVTGAGGLNQSVPVTYTDNVNVGTATANASYIGDDNHEASNGSSNFAITKASSTTTVNCPASQTYTGVAIEPCTASYSGPGGLSGTLMPTYLNNIDAGSATASATYAGDANHEGSTGNAGFTINKASSITTVNCPASATYTGSALEPCSATVTGTGGLNQSVTPVTYTDNINAGSATAAATYAGDANHNGSTGNGAFTINKAASTTIVTCPASQIYTGAAITPCSVTVTGPNLSLAPSASYANHTEVGTATASYTFAGDANHNGSGDSQTFAITKASSTTTVTCPAGQTYTGAALTPCSVTVTGVNLSLTPGASYANNTEVGTATASYTFAGDANHNGSSDSQNFAITKASSTTTVTCPAGQTYTGAALTPCSVTVTGPNLSLAPSASYANNTEVGTATASYTYAGDANHNGSSDSQNFAITKANATINVTHYSVTYDGNPHTAIGTATGVNGESLGGLDLSGTTHTSAGTYNGDPWTFTDGTGNYNNTSGTVNDSISQSTANITVNGYTGVYDGSAHGATGSATGVHGEDLTSLLNFGATFTNVTGGTAHWTFAGNTNYAPTSGDATITINKATPTITWSNPADIVYGTALSATQLNATASVAGSFNYSPASGAILLAGAGEPLLASFTPTDTVNYNPTSKSVMINVLKATPSFSNLSSPTIINGTPTTNLSGKISFGSFVPTGNVSITVNGVTQNAAIQAGGNFTSSFTSGSLAAGSYNIAYSYGGDSNFNSASGSGTLTIGYNIVPLYDQTKVRQSGSTIPIKLQITGANGSNLSSASTVVTAVGIALVSTTVYGPVEDAGNANPDNNFRFTSDSYTYNLQTTGLRTGVYNLYFRVGADPTLHTAQFQIK